MGIPVRHPYDVGAATRALGVAAAALHTHALHCMGGQAVAAPQRRSSTACQPPLHPQVCVVVAVYDPETQQVVRTQELHTGTAL